jgi:hypothetical protein
MLERRRVAPDSFSNWIHTTSPPMSTHANQRPI